VREVYLTDDPAVAAVLLDKVIVGCLADEVPEIRSLGTRSRPGVQRSSPPSNGSLEWSYRRAQPLREEG